MAREPRADGGARLGAGRRGGSRGEDRPRRGAPRPDRGRRSATIGRRGLVDDGAHTAPGRPRAFELVAEAASSGRPLAEALDLDAAALVPSSYLGSTDAFIERALDAYRKEAT